MQQDNIITQIAANGVEAVKKCIDTYNKTHIPKLILNVNVYYDETEQCYKNQCTLIVKEEE